MKELSPLERKIADIFSEESVYKDDKIRALFSGVNIPSFIKDWLLKKFFDLESGEVDREGILAFLNKYIPQGERRGEQIVGYLISHPGETVKLLTRIMVEPDIRSGRIKFTLPDLGSVKGWRAFIPDYLVREYDELKGGETWGVITLTFVKEKKDGYIELVDFKPFKPYEVDLDYYISARNEFTLDEWIDLLLRAMEYNPEGFESKQQKLNFLLRLLVFVEPNLNLIELAPKGTGKSYVFGNLSKYGWLISGGVVSRAKLFYDMQRKLPGLVTRKDFIALDEIQTVKFTDAEEIGGALKSYLENGSFTVGEFRGTGTAGFVLLGNIPLSENRTPLSGNYFKELPSVFQESALIDRFHGFIEGWKLPRMHEGMKVRGITLNVEYFSDILHLLRSRGEYASFVEDVLKIPPKADTRDKKAIVKITTSLVKLLFPNAIEKPPTKREMEFYCLKPAIHLRGIIKQQLEITDPEYRGKNLPEIRL